MVLLQLWSDYFAISLIVLFITIGIVAIVYMIGKVIRRKEIEDYATTEVYQGIASAFIIAIIIALILIVNDVIFAIFQDVGFSCSGSVCQYNTTEVKGIFALGVIPAGFELEEKVESCKQDILSSNSPCHIEIARSRLNTMNNVVNAYTASKLMTYGWIFTLETIGIGLKKVEAESYTGLAKKIAFTTKEISKVLPSKFAPFSWISMIREAFKTIFSVLYTISIYLSGVDLFLQFVEASMFSIFLVAGIALRTFTPTRRLGGLLIAISIGIYLIFPMLLILTSLIAPNAKFELEYYGNVFLSKGGEVYTFPANFFVFFKNVANTLMNLPSYLAIEIFGPFEKAAILFVWIFVQQLIVIYATVISVREISQFLGGDIEIAGLTRLL